MDDELGNGGYAMRTQQSCTQGDAFSGKSLEPMQSGRKLSLQVGERTTRQQVQRSHHVGDSNFGSESESLGSSGC